ncbi:CAP domain-containing protein [Tengunoibacter tsumagoiensis]|uniref:SCP domain-containing protein n=1 Tax=Tengunoibacter tsumagoiensis TaxID=2014871 RepID=A0A401ZZ58_9CHLR|nr:CAP domain-containing protein [Tengunoibacter tsumagoiensis]GCE12139.1 hypothetical protein KTT_19980 [Tengunoibacter tsumagoiensis]
MTLKKTWMLICLLALLLLSACGTQPQTTISPTPTPSRGYSLALKQRPPQPQAILLPTPVTPQPTAIPPTPPPPAPPIVVGNLTIPSTATGPAPYGQPPALTDEEIQLTQKLFAQINADRALRGLYAYTWNETLSGGARLHSWNMTHCGFSHTCPDGLPQCQRIANEDFPGVTDATCGENIAMAGPYPTAWAGALSIQEGMVNEPPSGFHRMHLLGTTLHKVGVGVYVDANKNIWFTEDFVS